MSFRIRFLSLLFDTCIKVYRTNIILDVPQESQMKLNESNVDRIIRAVAGVVLLYLGFGGALAGGLAIVADVLGAILLLTGAVGFCPLYAIFKTSTLKQ
jgi:hypothetical protein